MSHFSEIVDEHRKVLNDLSLIDDAIASANQQIKETFAKGRKVLLCGNGGSAADCQHIAAEFVVRYQKVRASLPAISLTTDTSILTAHPNDFEFETVFSRQIEALGNEGDCLIAISTSGNSANILRATKTAKSQDMTVIGMTGGTGGQLAGLVDAAVVVPSNVTARIQEMHILIAHWWCEEAEK
ncbi:MAG: Phosphoheptose isomerase 1 (EC [uncultured Thiotrichaceae bacterium]|uniref:Phosphoheptose isomerase 1 (EC) n=1 Tax=uncultured Thiotrichaceae bacterium TaxID=298394 RepID=A0A6S6T2N3_9GAMM|nr:MAG: Phosphoheptose isomerase 1 (EC [uncultured Thiotrichaceae bacterium]